MITKWFKIQICMECEERIYYNDVMNNSGICPHCGNNSKNTICDTLDVIIRRIYTGPWYNRKFILEGKDSFSKEWIKNNLS